MMRDIEDYKYYKTRHDSVKAKSVKKKTRLIRTEEIPENSKKGRVIISTGRIHSVIPFGTNDFENYIDCEIAGILISEFDNKTIVTVGDIVYYIVDESEEEHRKGTILKVDHRETWISRKSTGIVDEHVIASNVENLMIVMSAAEPFYNKRLIDRIIVSGLIGNMNICICINKSELMETKFLKKDLKIYLENNYQVELISAIENKGIAKFKKLLKDKTTLLIGPSGVGKSTIVNKLVGKELQKIQEVSDKTYKGKHTTSFGRILKLPFGGEIVDTPGIREFGIIGIEKEELTLYFKDFEEYYDNCKFMPCSHTHEPECAIAKAVEEGKIDSERYQSYLNIYNSIEEYEEDKY
jgi:ribosome biogenesis GTPase